jgi:microcystin-dependent protein
MTEPFLAEIRMFGFNFAPRGWARCDGALLPVSQNQALFSLLGTLYGGDGRTTFQLPDLRGRTPIGFADDYPQGLQGGSENATMTVANLPPHRHDVNCSTTESRSRIPTNQYPAQVLSTFNVNAYHAFDNSTTFAADALTSTGGGLAQNLMQPFSVINFCIAITGIFPSRS